MNSPASVVSPEGCTIDKFTVRSPAMERDIQAVIVLPPEYKDHPDKRYPVLYAFHGMDAPYVCFSEMIPLRKALGDKPMIVACFDADRASLYIDSPLPQKWNRDPQDASTAKSLFTTFFFEEYIPAIDQLYRTDISRRMLTGFSMGGFGAFHYLLSRPEMFVSTSGMSSFLPDLAIPSGISLEFMLRLFGRIDGMAARHAALNPYTRFRTLIEAGAKLPPLGLWCGTGDYLLNDSRKMRDFLTSHHVPFEYHEGPGDHTWPYWRDTSAAVIDFHWKTLQGK